MNPKKSLWRMAKYENGYAFKPEDFTQEGYPVIRIRQLVDPNSEADLYGGNLPSRYLLSDGDLVFSWSASLETRIWKRGPAWLNQHLFKVIPEPGIEKRWLRWLIDATIPKFQGLMHGSAMTHLNLDMLKQFTFTVPKFEEQRRIADFLDTETSNIEKIDERASRQEELLLERRRSFIDSLISGDSLRDPDWVPLRYVINPSLTTGREEGKVLSVYRDYGIIPKDSRSDNFNKTPEDLTRYLAVNVNDVVVNKMKAWQGSLGVSPYSGIVSPDYLVARLILPDIIPKYLHYTLRSPKFVEEYRIRSRGIRPAQWRLYWEDMAEIRFPVISPGRQREISDALEAEEQHGEGLLKAIRSRRKLLAERRQALITAAVTGQIDVTTARGADVS